MSATIRQLWGIHVTMVATLLFFSLIFGVEAILHVPIAYTRPAGLQRVNGSDPFGGCQQTPVNCSMTEGGVGVCRCPGNTQATGVLIDGVIPTIDPVSDMDSWSSELFTVNRNGQSSIVIGFSFPSPFDLRGVEMKLFNCPAWNIAASTINVYGSLQFPIFNPDPLFGTILGGSVAIDAIQDCSSLSTVTIPVQLNTSARNVYFIEMTFNGVSSAEWAPSIAEIQFSDETPTEPPTTQQPTTEPPTNETNISSSAISQVTVTTELPSTTGNIIASPTNTINTIINISMMSTPFNVTTNPSNIGSMISSSTSSSIIPSRTTTSRTSTSMTSTTPTTVSSTTDILSTSRITSTPIYVSTEDSIITSGTSTTNTGPTNTNVVSSNTTTIVVLVVIIGLLIVLLIIGAFAVLGFLIFQRSKKRKLEVHQLQSVTMEHPREQQPVRYSTIRETDTAANQYYEDLGSTGYSAIAMKDDELYTVVNDERKDSRDGLDTVGNGLYQDIDSKQTMTHNKTPPNLETVETNPQQVNKPYDYSKVEKPPGPPIPPKTPELYRDLQIEKDEELRTATDPPFVVVSEYTDVGGGDSELAEKEIYSEIGSSNQLSTSPGGPIILSKSLCNEMDENPDYESSGSAILFAGMAKRNRESDGGEVYANPDTCFNTQEEIYETIYSEPIQPSLFDSKVLDIAGEHGDIQPYAPVYSLAGLPPLSDDMLPLHVSHDNILETEDLGTGNFGNVVLAQTNDLSRKDLKLSETDDDKTVTLQVAIKTLKRNASEKLQHEFEKEQTFMARLNHPNVIRMLAVCSEDAPFIMMEYMENGDLNQYLQRFSSISNVTVHSESEIEVKTLVSMATQVASAMVYLTSKNYVHRDLATRNCLVGQNYLVKLGDFGMSRNLYESHYYILHGHAILPIRWMATECFYGKFSPKTDVWAFGVTVWEIFSLTKEQPYSQMGDRELTHDALKKEKRTLLEKPLNCPQEVYDDVMLKCWTSDPKERATFEELHETLSALNFNNS